MAVSKEFIHPMGEPRGLKANKDYTRFFYRFKIEGKEFTKLFDYSNKAWEGRDRKTNATKEAIEFKERKKTEIINPFNSYTKVDYIADQYFTKKCTDTKWNRERRRIYNLHIQPFIGNKKVGRIIENDIDNIRSQMEKISHAIYGAKGCSIRTIEKTLIQVLKPILTYAKSNGAIDRLPPICHARC